MANSRSARKQIRASERKRDRNRAVRTSVRTYVGKARRAVLEQPEGVSVEEALLAAVRALDRAAEKGIIHRNNARRRKSRLTAMAARIMQAGADTATVRATAAGSQKGTAKATRKPATKSSKTAKPRTTKTTAAKK